MSSVKLSDKLNKPEAQSLSQKRRNRRKKALTYRLRDDIKSTNVEAESQPKIKVLHLNKEASIDQPVYYGPCNCPDCSIIKVDIGTMTNDPVESREKVKAAREAKKAAKQQAKIKRDAGLDTKQPAKAQVESKTEEIPGNMSMEVKAVNTKELAKESTSKIENSPKEVKSKDEVDRAAVVEQDISLGSELDKEQVKADRAAKKAAKQAKKKGAAGDNPVTSPATVKADTEMTVRDVVQTLRDIKMVALEVKAVTAQVQALSLDKKEPEKKPPTKEQAQATQATETKPKPSNAIDTESTPKESEEGKSKAQLKAERRAKQEAQRAAKEAAGQAKTAAAKTNEQKAKNTQLGTQAKDDGKSTLVKEKSPKPKTASKQVKQGHRVNWFKHLYNDDKTKLDRLPINSNLHPAIIKLGVQLATRVVAGSNARCVALLDALKKMVRDYSLPARTEFGRGLEAHLAASLTFLWSMRQPTASQLNALNFFRHRLTQLPNNVDEFDAKKTLQEEIERYIREQIEMAGEAISITVRSKISDGDLILTYGCSSLIERILVEAYKSGLRFRVVVVGAGDGGAAREMTRRLAARRLPCLAVDILALGFVMHTVDKVVLGASALLANGSVLGAAGTGAVALAARGCNVPVLVACETHKFCERVHTDSFLYNELGDPDDLIDKSDENSPLKDWRSNPNLTPINLTYDVTPATLVTAVVTELGILPCTSAPVVLRFKLSEYSV